MRRGRFLTGAVSGIVVASLFWGGVEVVSGLIAQTTVVTACVTPKTGFVRIIDPAAGQTCFKLETQMTWNQEGPAGTPGAPGAPGATGPEGPAGESGFDLECVDEGAVPKWDDTASTWECGADIDTDTLTDLADVCTENQTVNFDGDVWECRSAPIVATLSDVRWGYPASGPDVAAMFDARSANIDGLQPCSVFGYCRIKLVDVVDHTTCQVILSGNRGTSGVAITPSTGYVTLNNLFVLYANDPLYVNVSCVR